MYARRAESQISPTLQKIHCKTLVGVRGKSDFVVSSIDPVRHEGQAETPECELYGSLGAHGSVPHGTRSKETPLAAQSVPEGHGRSNLLQDLCRKFVDNLG